MDEVIHEKPWLWAVVIGFALILPLSLAVSKIKDRKAGDEENADKVKNPIFAYIGASVVEWLMAGIVIYFALFAMGIHADIRYVFGVFVIAAIGGMISLVPGGFGSFDLLFLLGMEAAWLSSGGHRYFYCIVQARLFIYPIHLGTVLCRRRPDGKYNEAARNEPAHRTGN